jgi:tetratricopeptide (TPR) repeat protein
MGCKSYKRLIYLYIDRRLKPLEEEHLNAHLDKCPACRKELAEVKRSMEVLRLHESIEPQRDIKLAVFERLEKPTMENTGKIKSFRSVFIGVGVAACVLVGLVIFLMLPKEKPQAPPKSVITSVNKEDYLKKLGMALNASDIFFRSVLSITERNSEPSLALMKDELTALNLDKTLSELKKDLGNVRVSKQDDISHYIESLQKLLDLVKSPVASSEIKKEIKNSEIISKIKDIKKEVVQGNENTGLASFSIPPREGDPKDVKLFKKARENLYKGDYKKTAKYFTRFLRKYPNSTYYGEACLWVAESEMACGNYENALGYFADAKRSDCVDSDAVEDFIGNARSKIQSSEPLVFLIKGKPFVVMGLDGFTKIIDLERYPKEQIFEVSVAEGKRKLIDDARVFLDKDIIALIENVQNFLGSRGFNNVIKTKKRELEIDFKALRYAGQGYYQSAQLIGILNKLLRYYYR